MPPARAMRFRVVFFGTPQFAVPSLDALLAGPDVVAGVICQADRPAGRGQKLRRPPVAELALTRGVDVQQPTRIRDRTFEELLHRWQPDVIVVTAYGRILPRNILDLPRLGCINVHASLLPKYRGAAPIAWAIARGETETGVTIIQMSEAMDAGDILLQRCTPIGADETAVDLSERLSLLGADALMEALASLARGELVPVPQDEKAITLAPIIAKSDGEIDWSRSATEIANRCRAFQPWPSAFTQFDGKLLKVHAARATAPVAERAGQTPPPGMPPPGTIVSIGDAIEVVTGAGTLAVDQLQLEGRKRMAASEFARGAGLRTGMRLGAHG
jgi:methionyl-tRNA formyltransferase